MRYAALAFMVMAGVALSSDSPGQQTRDILYVEYLLQNEPETAAPIIRHLKDQGNPAWERLLTALQAKSPGAGIALPADLEEGFSLPPNPRMSAEAQAKISAEHEAKRRRQAVDFLSRLVAQSRDRAERLLAEDRREAEENRAKERKRAEQSAAEKARIAREEQEGQQVEEARRKARQKRLADYKTDKERIVMEKAHLQEEMKKDFQVYAGLFQINMDPMAMASDKEYNVVLAYKYEPTASDIDSFNLLAMNYVYEKIKENAMLKNHPHIRCRSFFMPPGQSKIVLQYGKAHVSYDGMRITRVHSNRYWWDWTDGE